MANENNIDGLISSTNSQLLANGYKIPAGFNESRQPGELASLFALNHSIIYNKFNAKTPNSGLLRFGPRQPFISFNPDTGRKGINAIKSAVPRIGAPLQDVERITKWQLTGNGVVFIAKQFVLQGQNAFNETKLYNPLTPVQAVVSNASFGVIPSPKRHLDFSGGFGSLLGFGTAAKPISTTVAENNPDAISAQAKIAQNAYKGMLRGAAASYGYNSLEQRWSQGSNGTSGGFLKSVGNYLKNSFNRAFGSYMKVGQPGIFQYRADEQTYGKMLQTKSKFWNTNSDGTIPVGVYQRFWAGKDIRGKSIPVGRVRYAPFLKSDEGIEIDTTGTFTVNNSSKSYGVDSYNENNDDGSIYSDYIGIEKWTKEGSQEDSLKFSDQVVNYVYYIGGIKSNVREGGKYFSNRSKYNDATDKRVQDIQRNLEKVIDGIKKADINANEESYSLELDNERSYSPLKQFNDNTLGYDYLNEVAADRSQVYFSGTRFKNTRTIDPISVKDGATSDNKHYGFAGTNRSDKINTQGVLSSNEFRSGRQYDYDNDDLIAFYFHDIVNDRYIPFRAIIRGISESLTAEWNDVTYIGRAEKMYNYAGFSRTLSLNFTVHINSIKELLPTWQRINYFSGLVKPLNYTKSKDAGNSKFIIPPLIKFSVGDLYVDQPAAITSIGNSIPDDAIWETFNENYAANNDWNYLNNVIRWKESKNKYAQLPRSVDISVSMNLLEKERPIAGGAHFGSSHRIDTELSVKNYTQPTFSSKLII